MAAYTTFLPSDALKPFIASFAISESAEEQSYKVLPGTGVVIGFQYKGRLAQLTDHGKTTLATSGITGLHDTYRVYINAPNTGTVLVYFKETGAFPFFGQPLHELFNESVSLDNFMLRSVLLTMEEQLCEAKTDPDKIRVVESFLIGRLKNVSADNLVTTALALIYKSKGDLRIKELAGQLNISQSPLEKRFRQVVGTSPKKFASIVRFKHILSQHTEGTSMTALGYESGFYDQAHFIKEFRSFTGETPEAFFKRSINP